jgi:hypothetical protein
VGNEVEDSQHWHQSYVNLADDRLPLLLRIVCVELRIIGMETEDLEVVDLDDLVWLCVVYRLRFLVDVRDLILLDSSHDE